MEYSLYASKNAIYPGAFWREICTIIIRLTASSISRIYANDTWHRDSKSSNHAVILTIIPLTAGIDDSRKIKLGFEILLHCLIDRSVTSADYKSDKNSVRGISTSRRMLVNNPGPIVSPE